MEISLPCWRFLFFPGQTYTRVKASGNVTFGEGRPAPSPQTLAFSSNSLIEMQVGTSDSSHTSELLQPQNTQTVWCWRGFSGFPRSSPEIKAVNNCYSVMINGCRFSFINILITVCVFWQLRTQRVWWCLQKQIAEVIHQTQLASRGNAISLWPAGSSPGTWLPGSLLKQVYREPSMRSGWRGSSWPPSALMLFSPQQLSPQPQQVQWKAPLQSQPLAFFCRYDWPLNAELLWQPFHACPGGRNLTK